MHRLSLFFVLVILLSLNVALLFVSTRKKVTLVSSDALKRNHFIFEHFDLSHIDSGMFVEQPN